MKAIRPPQSTNVISQLFSVESTLKIHFLEKCLPIFISSGMNLITIVIQRTVRTKSIELRRLTGFGLECPVKNGSISRSVSHPEGILVLVEGPRGDLNLYDSARMGLLLDPKMDPPIIRIAGLPKRIPASNNCRGQGQGARWRPPASWG